MTTPGEDRPVDPVAPRPPPPVPYEPTGAGADLSVSDPGPATPSPKVQGGPTRTSAVWAGVWAGVVVLILLIIFIAQNTAKVQISFFALDGQIPLALALLIAGVA